MSHVVTNQPVANPPDYDTVMNEAPELGNVPQPINPEELKRNDAHKEQSASVDDCCCYVDDDADFFCIALVRCFAGMFHGIGTCLDGCCEGCASCINSCCNDEGCCGDTAGDVPDPGGDCDCDCSGCDCSDCDCTGCFD